MISNRPAALLLRAVLLLLLVPSPSVAQQMLIEAGGPEVTRLTAVGGAMVLEAVGPALAGRREFYRPVPPLRMRHRWLLVQDSLSGVVFTAPSGVKTGVDDYEADLHLRALQGIQALEVRAVVFNVWGDPAGYLAASALDERAPGESWELHPRWRAQEAPTHEHRTSIVWVHRVMFDDGSVLEADLEAVAAAWSFMSETAPDALAEMSLQRASDP